MDAVAAAAADAGAASESDAAAEADAAADGDAAAIAAATAAADAGVGDEDGVSPEVVSDTVEGAGDPVGSDNDAGVKEGAKVDSLSGCDEKSTSVANDGVSKTDDCATTGA